MKLKYICPCCNEVQFILFDESTGEITGALFNKEKESDNYSSQDALERELLIKHNILLG